MIVFPGAKITRFGASQDTTSKELFQIIIFEKLFKMREIAANGSSDPGGASKL